MSKCIERFKKFMSEYKEILIWTGLLCTFVFSYIKISGKTFTTCNDQIFQYDAFYREWYRLLKGFITGKGLPMYSWNDFLGSDFYSSMGYYVTGDIFSLILFPLYLIGISVKRLLTLEIYLCIFISSVSMYALLKTIGIKKKYVLVCTSLLYAFCNCATEYYGQYMFHRFFAFMPLLFLSAEIYFKNKKICFISVTTLVLFLQNFYFMYPTTIFLFVYCLAREIEFKKNWNDILKDALHMALGYLCGAIASMFVVLPSAMYTLGNPRVGSSAEGIFYDLKTYCGILLSGIVARMPAGTEYSNIFFTDNDHYSSFNLTVGIIYIASAFITLSEKNKKSHLIAFGFMLICFLVKPLSSFMHGFSGNTFRWTFLLLFYLLILGAQGIESEKKNGTVFACSYLMLFLIAVIYLFATNNATLQDHKEHILLIFISFIISIIIWVVYSKNKKFGTILNVAFAFAVSAVFLFVKIDLFPVYYSGLDRNVIEYYENEDEDILHRYYISNDYINPYAILNGSLTLDYGFLSSKTYNTQYEFCVADFLKANGINWHFISIDDPDTLLALGTKYWVVYSEEELPENYEFEYYYSPTYLQVYENKNYQGFGYITDDVDYWLDDVDTGNMLNTTYVSDTDFDLSIYCNQKYTKFNVTSKGNNSLCGNIETDSESLLYLPIPNNKGWKVYVNGDLVETIDVNGGFIGISLDSGYSEIEMYFTSPYLKEGLVLSGIGLLGFIYIIILDKKRYA